MSYIGNTHPDKKYEIIRHPLYCAKEEVRELERLLKEAKRRLAYQERLTSSHNNYNYTNWFQYNFYYVYSFFQYINDVTKSTSNYHY